MRFMVRRGGLAVLLIAGAASAVETTVAAADTPSGLRAVVQQKKKPVVPAKAITNLSELLDLPRRAVKRGLARLEKSNAEQMPSGPNALAPDAAIRITHFTSFEGEEGERIFFVRLGAAPGDAVNYEYGLGVALEDQPTSVPIPAAPVGFGRVALTRTWLIRPGGVFLAFDPAARAPVASEASGMLEGRYVIFRVPDTELGSGTYYLQALGREGQGPGSAGGYSIVMATLKG
jgi:hypothetical protein